MDRRWPLTLIIAGVLACGDPSGIGGLTGAFNLAAVDATPPPALLGATLNCDEFADAGLLNLYANAYDLSLDVIQDCRRSGGDSTVVLLVGSGATQVRGDTLVLTDTTGTKPEMSVVRDGKGLALRFLDSATTFLPLHLYHFTPQPFINRH
ncbi:MAG TPA: hypothetical protein VN674_06720 [Gemmatimonadales bacterium]|nr:hypothetical protein [Gemmatimonadales bacterium]